MAADSLEMYPIVMMFDVVGHCIYIAAFMHLIQIQKNKKRVANPHIYVAIAHQY